MKLKIWTEPNKIENSTKFHFFTLFKDYLNEEHLPNYKCHNIRADM